MERFWGNSGRRLRNPQAKITLQSRTYLRILGTGILSQQWAACGQHGLWLKAVRDFRVTQWEPRANQLCEIWGMDSHGRAHTFNRFVRNVFMSVLCQWLLTDWRREVIQVACQPTARWSTRFLTGLLRILRRAEQGSWWLSYIWTQWRKCLSPRGDNRSPLRVVQPKTCGQERTIIRSPHEFLKWLNIELPCDAAISFLGVYAREIKANIPPKFIHKCLKKKKKGIIHQSQDVETTRVSVGWWMDK